MEIRYNCTENDNIIRGIFETDNKNKKYLEELHISDPLDKSRIVIGFEDLKQALKLNGFKIKKI